ncbi:MAG: alpha/beta hydrolase [Bacteroidota bacterium]
MKIYLSFLLFFLSLLSVHAGLTGDNSIDSTTTITVGNSRQFLSIKGDHQSNPILLYLHGGPGQSAMKQADKITSKLEKKFVVVHWDQRKSGKTAELNSSNEEVTIEKIKNDAEQLLQYLLLSFEREKIYLVGHSWGTVLGFHLAKKYPESLYAYVAISPLVDLRKSGEIALEVLKNHFEALNNQKAVDQLATIKIPYENLEQSIILYRWQTEMSGEKVTDEQVEQAMPYFRQWEKDWWSVNDHVFQIDQFKETPALECPVYFFVGVNDYQTNYEIAENYFESVRAPHKKLFWFKQSAHNIPGTEPDLMQQIILEEILTDIK